MSRVRQTATIVATSVAAALAAVVVPVSSARAVEGEYVAVGDSYASGLGTRAYYPDSGACKRSPHAYAVDHAARLGVELSFQACAGAAVSDVRSGQLGTLDAGTGLVSVQVGGNDAGFPSVLTECAKPVWAQDCAGAVEHARATVNGELPGRLARLYADIALRAPSAVVLVAGYPRQFHDEDCNAGPSSARPTGSCSTTRRTCSTPGSRSRPSPPNSRSRTPLRRSSATRSATSPSGSTACPARSQSPTTRTVRDRTATATWSGPPSADAGHRP